MKNKDSEWQSKISGFVDSLINFVNEFFDETDKLFNELGSIGGPSSYTRQSRNENLGDKSIRDLKREKKKLKLEKEIKELKQEEDEESGYDSSGGERFDPFRAI